MNYASPLMAEINAYHVLYLETYIFEYEYIYIPILVLKKVFH